MQFIYLIDVNIIAGVILGVYECLVHTHAVTLQDIQVLPEMEKIVSVAETAKLKFLLKKHD